MRKNIILSGLILFLAVSVAFAQIRFRKEQQHANTVYTDASTTITGSWSFSIGSGQKVDITASPYNAIADGGTTNNATAINAAIIAAGAGGTVRIPCGNNFYGVSSTITISSLMNVTIEGDGDCSQLVNMQTGGQHLITVIGASTSNRASGVRLKNFSMAGHASSGHGISVGTWAIGGYLEGIFCRNVGGDCFNIDGSGAPSWGWTLIQPRFTVNTYPAGVIGPFPYAGASAGADYGIRAIGGANAGTLTIIGPLIEGLGQWGVRLDAENSTIIGGTIEGNVGGNIWLEGNAIKVYGTNAEVGGDADAGGVKVQGNRNVLSGMLTAGGTPNDAKLELVSANWTLVENSSFNTITIDADSTYNKFINVWYGTNSGSFTDSGVGNSFEHLHNTSNANQRASDKRSTSTVNYARNGGFERWVSVSSLDAAYAGGFSAAGSPTIARVGDGETDTIKFAGHYSVKVTGNATPPSGLVYQGTAPRYISSEAVGIAVSVWARTDAATATFDIAVYYDAGATVHSQSFTATTTWQKFSAAFPFRTGKSSYDVRLLETIGSKIVYFDNLFISDGFTTQLGDWDNLKLQEPEPVGHTTLTFSATPTIYGNQATFQSVTVTANITGITLSGWIPGIPVWLKFLQGGGGGFTVGGWPTVKWAGGSAPVITVTAGKADLQCLVYDGTDYWDCGLRQNQ